MRKSAGCGWTRTVLLTIALLWMSATTMAAAGESTENIGKIVNRANIVFVLDASNSMNYTDDKGLRYEAIEHFLGMLTEEGNYLGGVVFSNHVRDIDGLDLHLVNGQAKKKALVDALSSWTSTGVTETMGYTNIGEGLDAAVRMLIEKGSPDLPSYIVFLSDGNTEMPTSKEFRASLTLKGDAVYEARNNHISILSICLNADRSADTDEMSSISGDSGKFEEVTDADDLDDVYMAFIELVTGTPIIDLNPDSSVFPPNGELDTPIQVPTLGVEEANIIIKGNAECVALLRPDSTELDYLPFLVVDSSSYKQIKIPESHLQAGRWLLKTTGVPGEMIDIGLHYSSNLVVDADVEPETLEAGSPLIVSAVLRAGSVTAQSDGDYAGYSAEVVLTNVNGNEYPRVPMTVKNGKFMGEITPNEGKYSVSVHVTAEYEFSRDSNSIGPINVTSPSGPGLDNPEPPEPVETPIEKTVYILPFRDRSLVINLAELATDPADNELRYTVANSTFRSGTDYTIDSDNVLTVTKFSLSRGYFLIRATNSNGLSCDVEINIKCHNVGIITLVVAGILGLIVLIILGILLVKALINRSYGSVTVMFYPDGRTGEARGKTIKAWQGRYKLSNFKLGDLGGDLIASKCYLQATGKRDAILHTNIKIRRGRMETQDITLPSNVEVELRMWRGLDESRDANRLLTIKFESRIRPRPPRRPGR